MIRYALAFLLAAVPAFAHEWYAYECCSGTDCKPLTAVQIKETPEGWLLVETGRIVPYDFHRIRQSQDDQYHLCTTGGDPMGKILCLYVPPMGF